MEPNADNKDASVGAHCSRPEYASWLVDWDELDAARQRELFEHAHICPSCGPRLDLLKRTAAWLEQAAAPTAGVCPSAEDLYDFGRGPGARHLSEPERVSLKAHVADCRECGEFVATLASRPPAPLLVDEPAPEAREAEHRFTRVASPRRRLAWVPLAAAAALAIVFVWRLNSTSEPRASSTEQAALRIRYPADPLLRGVARDALLFPRDRMLSGPQGLFSAPVFELLPVERASSYRVLLMRHDGSAFADGQTVATLSGAAPLVSAGADLASKLEPAHYTWEAWAVVDGLDVPLGRRDFEVVADAGLIDEIAARESAPEPARSESLLHLLHDAGFVGDARAFARTLPATPERDAYLARLPGR
jgi:hypothetical protein